MKLAGLQKLTLLDFPGKVACTVFTSGCNFKCLFCHNATLALQHLKDDPTKESFGLKRLPELPHDEFFSFLRKRQGLLDGVCITGGEPLLHSDIDEFIKGIRALRYSVKLDTNGYFPEKLEQLLNDGLVDYVAMDIKNSLDKYQLTTGTSSDAKQIETLKMNIQKSVDILKSCKVPFEFRTTVVKQLHAEEDFESIGKWLGPVDRYFLQNFVDSGDLIDKTMTGCSEEEMKHFLEVTKKFIPHTELRGI